EEPSAAAPRIVDAVLRAKNRLSTRADVRAILATGRDRDHALRKPSPAAVAVPGDLRPYGRAHRTGDRPMHRQLRRHPERLRSVCGIDALRGELVLKCGRDAIGLALDDRVGEHPPEADRG